MHLPDYKNRSIVNLLSSIQSALGSDDLLYATLPELEPHRLAGAKHIVLIVIDGLGYEYLVQHDTSTFCRHLLARITSVFPSTTASAITTFFTGTAPQQHGLVGWFTYFKELGAVVAPLPFRPRFGKTALGGSGVEARRLFDQPSLFDKINGHHYVVLPQRIVDSDYTRALSGPVERRAYTSLEECFQRIQQILSTSDRRTYTYAYWPDLDSLAHAYGMGSKQVATLYEQLDAAFTRFLSHIDGSGATVIVTADHGIIDSDPEKTVRLEDNPELAETLVLPLCGEPRVAFCYVHPHMRQQFEDYVRVQLAASASLFKSRDLVSQGYFGLGEPHPRLFERIGDYTLVMKERYVIKDWLLGEHRYVQVGVHGGVSEEEMYVPLIVVET